MAVCGSLQHIFENSIPEKTPSSFIDSLSSSLKQIKPTIDHSFTEIFGELHFKENPSNPTSSSSSSPPPRRPPSLAFPIDLTTSVSDSTGDKWGPKSSFPTVSYHRKSKSLNSESLQMCTEGLGFESLDNVDDLKVTFQNHDNNNNNNDKQIHDHVENNMRGKMHVKRYSSEINYRKGKNKGRAFPPPISTIGIRTGKACVCFQSYREDGRFVLEEVRIPTQESLHAYREDGRLRLSFVQPSDQYDDDATGDDDGREEGDEGQ